MRLSTGSFLSLLVFSFWYASSNLVTEEIGPPSLSVTTDHQSPFKIILDGGSTGSRLHIFEFVEVRENDNTNGTDNNEDNYDNTNRNTLTQQNINGTKIQCVRRGSSRADIPLSAFGRLSSDKHIPLDPNHVADHLIPLFEYASTIIPDTYHKTTGVYYQATAGMRLLEESEQEAVYDALYQGLRDNPKFVFHGMERKDITTLSGEMEAYYGALAANYLQGVIDAELRLIVNNVEDNHNDHIGAPVVGALDMGGSSTQIVYMANHEILQLPLRDGSRGCLNPKRGQCLAPESPQLNDEHFFSTSYLSYGVDQFRERLWNMLVAERAAEAMTMPESCGSKTVSNPCANKGYEVEWQEYILVGSGNATECIQYTKRLIPHPDKAVEPASSPQKQMVGGVEHPPVRGKFLAMSLYFFSLDSLRVFSEPKGSAHTALNLSWPNPSIKELEDALDGLCSRDWHTDMALQEGVHAFTRAEVLPHRCLETVYMVTLLKEGFGFHPSSRDITFTFLVDGDEVEWTLGMALAMNAEETYLDGHDTEHRLEMRTIDKQFAFQGMLNPSLFGVTLPPTHCC